MRIFTLAVAASLVAGTIYGAASDQSANSDLRRVDCTDVTVFAPESGTPDADICRNHGGLAIGGAMPNTEGLVILVRNQPMGGFDGQSSMH